MTGPGTGPSTEVRGGRAANRAERQAIDAVRRKELRRAGETMTAKAYLEGDDDPVRRSPHRLAVLLVAIAVVALGVLGVYSYLSPNTQEAGSGGPAGGASAPSSGVEDTSVLPPIASGGLEPSESAPPAAVTPVPVTVLNATQVTGLAARVAAQLEAGGWETADTGAYKGGDVAVTTVFYAPGDENQRQNAQKLIEQFPDIKGGPTELFFELPESATPGLVVVTAGDWQP